MKHTRISTTVRAGHLPAMVRRQIAALLSRVKDDTQIVVELFEQPVRRTLAQNDFFHAAVMPWAKEEGHRIEDLKRDLLGAVFGWVDSPLGETRVPRKPHTSQLTTEEFTELIERTVEIAAECGYIIQFPYEYRESKWTPSSLRRSA